MEVPLSTVASLFIVQEQDDKVDEEAGYETGQPSSTSTSPSDQMTGPGLGEGEIVEVGADCEDGQTPSESTSEGAQSRLEDRGGQVEEEVQQLQEQDDKVDEEAGDETGQPSSSTSTPPSDQMMEPGLGEGEAVEVGADCEDGRTPSESTSESIDVTEQPADTQPLDIPEAETPARP